MSETNIVKEILPYGERLRVLLAHSELSSSNHRQILNSKGVFLSDYDKNNTVPALMNTLLDPTEYNELIELQSSKEEKVKYRTLQLPWKGGDNLLKLIPESLNLNTLVEDDLSYKPTYKIIGSPKFNRVDGKKDHIRLDFKIERENNTKGWDERKTVHEGSLTIVKNNDGNIQLVTKKTHTSKETYDVGELLLKKLKSHFKENSLVEKEADFERILFNHFTNQNRIQFFFGFTSDFHHSVDFSKLTNITVGPDQENEPHKDLKDFLKDIENLKLKGEALQTHMIIAKPEYHDKLVFSSMTSRYKFRLSEGNGSFDVEYVFYDYEDSKNLKSEFQFHIQRITLDKGYRQVADKSKIRKILNAAVEEHKLNLYNKFKA